MKLIVSIILLVGIVFVGIRLMNGMADRAEWEAENMYSDSPEMVEAAYAFSGTLKAVMWLVIPVAAICFTIGKGK